MATKTSIPQIISHLANEFHTNIFVIDLKSTLNSPTRDTLSPTRDTLSSSASTTTYELFDEDYTDMSNSRHIQTVNYLLEIATEMNSAGYLNQCIQIYTKERASVISAIFQRLEVQKLSQHDPRFLSQDSLGSLIRDWCRAANTCVNFLFLHEKRLCHQIFQGLGNVNYEDACFVETIKKFVTQLFDSAEALSSVQPSPANLFIILDLYENLSDLLPHINDLFSSEQSESIRVRPAQLLLKLAELIRRILSEIGHLPRYVMKYVLYMCDYNQTLMELILSKPLTDVTDEFVDYEEQTPLSLHLTLIVAQVVSNLEDKSKLYKEAHLGKILIMKNIDYIVGRIEGSPELQGLIGDAYLKKLSSKLCQVKVDFLGLTFDKMLYCLRVEGLNRGGIFPSRNKKMTKRLTSFNEEFAKAHKYPANLVVPDSKLVVDLRKSILKKLKPAYSSFLEQLKSVTGRGKPAENQHIKYSVQDLETAIRNLFKAT